MSQLLDLLKGNNYDITENITLRNPTLDEISKDDEDLYYTTISMLCSTPTDYMVFLNDEMGIDWETISEYEWFVTLVGSIPKDGMNLVFKNFNLDNKNWVIDNKTNEVCLIDDLGNIIITPKIYNKMVNLLRNLHGFEKNVRMSASKSAHSAIIDDERKKIRRRKFYNAKNPQKSVLYSTISILVNLEGFKYNYSTVWDMHIYQFTDALKSTQKIKYYNQLMSGIYAGTVDSSKINKKDLLLFDS